MHPSKRWMSMIAAVALVALTAACGGQPANEPAPAEEPAPAATTPEPAATTPAPAAVPEPEPAAPQQPQLTGNIVEVGDGAMDWFNAARREVPGRYWWEVNLRNDTTQTLDITVTFQFLDADDGMVKTDRKTVRMQPAETGKFRVEGEMELDLARSVAGYTYSWDWEIVTAE